MAFGASAQAVAHVRSYAEAEAFLAAKGVDSRKICGNNTYVERRGEDIAIRLHQTDIITFLKAASPLIVLSTGGWHSLITKQRLEQFLPAPLAVMSFKGQWRISFGGDRWARNRAETRNSVIFTDGLRLIWNGVGWEALNAVTPEQEKQTDDASRKLDKAVKTYVAKLMDKVPDWAKELRETQTLKTSSDPWCCLMGIGAGDTDHLWLHLQEHYVFPTIIVRAFEDSGRYDDGRYTPAEYAVRAVAFGWDRRIKDEVTKYFKKRLDPVRALSTDARTGEPVKPNATLERYAKHAKDVLQFPSDYGYFGKDEALYKTSAPTFGRNRDSEYIDNANFEIVWETLVEEFPDLVNTEQDRLDENPGGIYVHGASHWACGWVEQIVVPVLADKDKPVGPSNLHPAFVKVCEFAEQVKMYPALPGAEERAAETETADIIKDIQTWQDYVAEKRGDPWIKAFTPEQLEVHAFNQYGERSYAWFSDGDEDSPGVLQLHARACYVDSLAQVDG